MCGIAGIFLRQASCDPGRVRAMTEQLVHRGPDDCGVFTEDGVGLGHRRLSIIDLGGGHQPMRTADERYTIVYNGEIYNYQALRLDLERTGRHFASHSDTEVILHLHAVHGDRASEMLNGIFAYALWDRAARRLLLVRDRAGIKPLYLAQTAQGLTFGSEIKALFASGLITARLNEPCVPEYLLYRQVAGTDTLFAGVTSLAPGHLLEVRDGVAGTPRSYWSLRSASARFEGSYEDAVDELDRVLNRAVARQLMSDVPLGTFCSGGIDSSLTTAIGARHAGRTINTFSVGFDEAAYDESEYARMASRACGTDHHELRVSEESFASLLPELIWHQDQPLNFANGVHIFALSKLARRHVTVVLTGEGADELFGGYPRYYIPKMVSAMQSMPKLIRRSVTAMARRSPDRRLTKLADLSEAAVEDLILYNSTSIDPALARSVAGDLSLRLDFRRQCLASIDDPDLLARVSVLDFQTYLVSILERQDKMSMATSIEARVPFLDNELVDFAQSLPSSFKQTLRHRKRVLKDVALRYLPAPIVHRRKSGFGVPLAAWFSGSGPMGRLLDECITDRVSQSPLRAEVLTRLVAEHRAGARDHSEILWSSLNFILWKRRFAI